MDLEYNVKTDSELITENEKVPPLILQPFVENALWHGLSKKKGIKQLNITISVLSGILKCVVEDNGHSEVMFLRMDGPASRAK